MKIKRRIYILFTVYKKKMKINVAYAYLHAHNVARVTKSSNNSG